MDVAMMWFDNDKKTELQSKVENAAKYYQEKYGVKPNMCHVHPDTGKDCQVGSIEVCTAKNILPNNFWIGVHED